MFSIQIKIWTSWILGLSLQGVFCKDCAVLYTASGRQGLHYPSKVSYELQKPLKLFIRHECKSNLSQWKITHKTFVDKLRAMQFPEYTKHTCVYDAYQVFVITFLSAVDSVVPIHSFVVKSNTNPWFDIDVLNAIGNRDNQYKNSNKSRKLIKVINM